MSEWVVSSEESGSKLLAFIVQQLGEEYSARSLKKMIEHNACSINGRIERFASTTVGRGDRVLLRFDQPRDSRSEVFDHSRILYEDESLLVYDKPSGINCDKEGILSLWKSTLPRIQLIHRLDRETTGALLLAKEPAAYHAIVEQFREFKVKKRYLAIVDKRISPSKGKVEDYLGKLKSYEGQTIWGKREREHGVYACTEWVRLAAQAEASLVACYPLTGRTHQLRVHLASLGNPILGDFQYGRQFVCSYCPPRILLHSESIEFYHPMKGNEIKITAPEPNDFRQARQALMLEK